MEQALVARAGIDFTGIDTGQVRGINPLTALGNLVKIAQGVRQSLAIVRRFRPDVCFVTGGYVCVPVVIACRLRRIPVLIYLPDIVPGWAIRWLSRLAQRVAITLPQAATPFGGEAPQGKAVVTGYPVRAELLAAVQGGKLAATAHTQHRQCVRQELARRLQRPLMSPTAAGQALPLLLVWGGSQGSRNINQSTWAALPKLLPEAHVLHIVGERDWPLYLQQESVATLPTELSARYHPLAYLYDEMALALAAADLTIARAGASSLGEFTIARLPSILVPLLGVNQLQNAQALAEHGAAVIVADATLKAELAPTALALLRDPERRQHMQNALAALARPDAASNIAAELDKLRMNKTAAIGSQGARLAG